MQMIKLSISGGFGGNPGEIKVINQNVVKIQTSKNVGRSGLDGKGI